MASWKAFIIGKGFEYAIKFAPKLVGDLLTKALKKADKATLEGWADGLAVGAKLIEKITDDIRDGELSEEEVTETVALVKQYADGANTGWIVKMKDWINSAVK